MNLFKKECSLKESIEVIRDKLKAYETSIAFHSNEVERLKQELKDLKESLKKILL